MGTEDTTLFTTVDRTGDPDFFTRFLDEGNRLPGIVASKPMIIEGLRLAKGDHVLDAGCGPGADVVEIARLVGPGGRVVGVDVSETMIGEARDRTEGSDLPVSFEVGDAQALAFPDASFDACRSERMLMHVPDADRALSELVRVAKPGGRLCVFDFDWDTLVVDSPYRETTRAIARSFADAIRNGWIGRQLPRMFSQHGLREVSVRNHQIFLHYQFFELLLGGHLVNAQRAGTVTAAEVELWWQTLERANAEGHFLAAITAFIVSGTKPTGHPPPT